MDHYTRKKIARTTDPGRILSSPKLLRLADPGAFALIGTEHGLVVSHTLAATTTAASLIMVTLSELDVFPLLVSAGTSLDFVLDGHRFLVPRPLAGSLISTPVTAGAESRARVRVRFLEGREGPKSITVADGPV